MSALKVAKLCCAVLAFVLAIMNIVRRTDPAVVVYWFVVTIYWTVNTFS